MNTLNAGPATNAVASYATVVALVALAAVGLLSAAFGGGWCY